MNALQESLEFFGIIMAELIVLFLLISLIVELIQQYVTDEKIRNILQQKNGLGNVYGAILGGLTPFCSCSTIPMVLGLVKAKAPFGATMAFLLASPLINPIVLGLFWVMFGWEVTMIYASVAFVLIIVFAFILEKMKMDRFIKNVVVTSDNNTEEISNTFNAKFKRSLQSAWKELKSIFPYMAIGVAIGAGIYGFVPQDLVVSIAGPDNPLAIPIAAVVGIPLYVRVETMIPIGLAFLEKGMSMGAIMALIIGGSGASIPEISMLSGIFQPRLVGAFVVTIFSVAVLAGFSFEFIL